MEPGDAETAAQPMQEQQQQPQQQDALVEESTQELQAFHVAVHAQYLIPKDQIRAASAPAPAPAAAPAPASEQKAEEQQQHDGDEKKRGRNKKRPRDAREKDADKLCLAVARGESCPFGEKCKFDHDIKAWLSNKPQDISDECFLFQTYGHCPSGIRCRFGGKHIDAEAGISIRAEGATPVPEEANVLGRDTQQQLRRDKYPFKTQRAGTKHKRSNSASQSEETKQEDGNETAEVSVTPFERPRKSVNFEGKVYIAPLTTVGNLPFRRVLKRLGADITCGEMAMSNNLLEGQNSEWALLRRHASEDVFGVQIAGAHADQMTRMAELLENECNMDFVDINCGCPIDVVVNRGGGSALMMRSNKLQGIVQGMTSVLSTPITIKMRSGWDTKKPIAQKLVPQIQKWNNGGIGAIMIHGRSRLQRYTKTADWDFILEAAQSQSDDFAKIPVIGNGDILSYQDWAEHQHLLYDVRGDGVDTNGLVNCAMIGRGALIKPWISTEIKEQRHWDISATERLDMMKDFVNFGLEHWGSDQQGVNTTRRFLLEWMSFLHRYVPVGLLERLPQRINEKPPAYYGRSDLETLLASANSNDWIRVSELLLGRAPEGFVFQPKHRANAYAAEANVSL